MDPIAINLRHQRAPPDPLRSTGARRSFSLARTATPSGAPASPFRRASCAEAKPRQTERDDLAGALQAGTMIQSPPEGVAAVGVPERVPVPWCSGASKVERVEREARRLAFRGPQAGEPFGASSPIPLELRERRGHGHESHLAGRIRCVCANAPIRTESAQQASYKLRGRCRVSEPRGAVPAPGSHANSPKRRVAHPRDAESSRGCGGAAPVHAGSRSGSQFSQELGAGYPQRSDSIASHLERLGDRLGFSDQLGIEWARDHKAALLSGRQRQDHPSVRHRIRARCCPRRATVRCWSMCAGHGRHLTNQAPARQMKARPGSIRASVSPVRPENQGNRGPAQWSQELASYPVTVR